jgi:hypothetical protein
MCKVVRPLRRAMANHTRECAYYFLGSKIDNVLASIAVKDLKAAAAWYEKLFRRPADSTPMPEVAEWKFERGGWLQVYQLPERAGQYSPSNIGCIQRKFFCLFCTRTSPPKPGSLAFSHACSCLKTGPWA